MRRLAFLSLLCIAATAVAITPGSPYLIKDIALAPSDYGSSPTSFHVVGSRTYFLANSREGGDAIWVTDGTGPGTKILAFHPFTSLGIFGTDRGVELADLGGFIYFAALDGDEYQLWKSDGTPTGTSVVGRLPVGATPHITAPRNLASDGQHVYFTYKEGPLAYAQDVLWMSDGTAAGTRHVPGDFRAQTLISGEHAVYFTGAHLNDVRTAFWRTDGTATGTYFLTGLYPNARKPEYAWLGGALCFLSFDALVKVDDRPGGIATTIQTTPNPDDTAGNLAAVGNMLYFLGGPSSTELWKSDGTQEGTSLVTKVAPTTPLLGAAAAGGRYFFLSSRLLDHRSPLWVSDGTAAGTKELPLNGYTLSANAVNTIPMIVGAGDHVLVAMADSGGIQQLWRSDGTAAGTKVVKQFTSDPVPPYIVLQGNTALFSGHDRETGRELWRSDGTPEGTTLVRDLFVGTKSAVPGELTEFAGDVYFLATDTARGLWRTGGTAGSTIRVTPPLINPDHIRGVCGNRLFFSTPVSNGTGFSVAPNGLFAPESWQGSSPFGCLGRTVFFSSGGKVGTRDENGAVNFVANVSATAFAATSSLMYFTVTVSNGIQLWRSDGTAAGTKALATLPSTQIVPIPLITAGENAFVVYDRELWVSRGTEESTQRLLSGHLLSAYSFQRATAGSRLVFFETGGGTDAVWTSDGTAAGTGIVSQARIRLLTPLVSDGQRAWWITEETSGAWLSTTDGTTAGTSQFALIGPSLSIHYELIAGHGRVAYGGTLVPITVSDGTKGGTVRVFDGKTEWMPTYRLLTITDNALYFSGGDTSYLGDELWTVRFDGLVPRHRGAGK